MRNKVGAQSHKSSGIATVGSTTAIPLTKIASTSSSNTTFTATRVTDASSWTLTGAIAGDVAVTSDGKRGIVVSTATNIVNVNEWVDESGNSQIPANGSIVTIHRLNFVTSISLEANQGNSADVYIGLYGDTDSSDYPLSKGKTIEIKPDGDAKLLDVTRIYVKSASGTQYVNYGQGMHILGVGGSGSSGGTLPSSTQGDIIYASGIDTYTNLHKSTDATRYIGNTGTSNNPAWGQVNLANGVVGVLPVINGGGFINVLEYGAVGNGISDDSGAISSAITAAANNTLLFPAGTYKLSSNVTVPSSVTIWFTDGAKLSIDSGKTFTMNGKLKAGLYQIFSGAGSVVISGTSVEYVLPQWWGAPGTGGVFDCVPAFTKANTVATASNIPLVVPPGVYSMRTAITLNSSVILYPGVIFSVDSGSDLIFAGKLSAPLTAIFSYTSIGVAKINRGVCISLHPQWWGALGDDAADDTSAIQRCINCAQAGVRNVFLINGTYKITAKLSISTGITFHGNDMIDTCIKVYGGVDGIEVIQSGSGAELENTILEKFRLYRSDDHTVRTNGVFSSPITLTSQPPVASTLVFTWSAIRDHGGDVAKNMTITGTDVADAPLVEVLSVGQDVLTVTTVNVFKTVSGIVLEAGFDATDNLKIEAPSGTAIVINPSRGARVSDVWIGGHVSGGHGFAVGISVGSSPAYYVDIYRCNIYYCTKGIWLDSGANDTRIHENNIWYGNYSAWIANGSAGNRLINNTFENYGVNGVYITGSNGNIIKDNWIESSNRYAVYLDPAATRTEILGNSISFMADGSSPIYNNSGYPYQSIESELIPIGTKFIPTTDLDTWAYVGKIYPDIVAFHALNLNILCTKGDLNLSATEATHAVTATAPIVALMGRVGLNDLTPNGDASAIACSIATNLPALHIYGGSRGLAHVYSGEIELGQHGSGNPVSLFYGGSDGVFTIQNKLDLDVAEISLKLRTLGTPIYPFRSYGTGLNTLNGLTTMIAKATNERALTIAGGSEYAAHAYSGQFNLGSNSNAYGKFVYGGNTGVMYIENTYDNDAGYIYIRTKAGGTPINAIVIAGNGNMTMAGSVSSKTINGAVSPLTNAATIACDMSLGNVFTFSTTAAIGNVQINATNGVAGQRATFIITDDATGGHVVTFGTNFQSGITLTGLASKTQVIEFIYDGSTWKTLTGSQDTIVVAASNSRNKYKADYVCDGTADNVEIQAAIDVVTTLGGKVRLLEGTYTITTAIAMKSNVCLEGMGTSATKILTTADIHMLTGVSINHFSIKDIWFYGGGASLGGYKMCIWLDRVTDALVENCKTENTDGDGAWAGSSVSDAGVTYSQRVRFVNVESTANDAHGIEIGSVRDVDIISCFSHHNTQHGLELWDYATQITVTGGDFSDNTQCGITIRSGQNIIFEGVKANRNGVILYTAGAGFYIYGQSGLHSRNITISNCMAVSNITSGIDISAYTDYIDIIGVDIRGSSIGVWLDANNITNVAMNGGKITDNTDMGIFIANYAIDRISIIGLVVANNTNSQVYLGASPTNVYIHALRSTGTNVLNNNIVSGELRGVQESRKILAIGQGSVDDTPIFSVPWDCRLVQIRMVPKTTITGADTNYMTLKVIDKGLAGSGTSELSATAFTSGINATAFVENVLSNGGPTSATYTLHRGDVISFKKEETLTGMAMPELEVTLELIPLE